MNPNLTPLASIFEAEFFGMTVEAVSVAELEQVRVRLIKDVQSRLISNAAQFLRTLVDGEPDADVIGLPAAADLPAVQWKLQNILKLHKINPKSTPPSAKASNRCSTDTPFDIANGRHRKDSRTGILRSTFLYEAVFGLHSFQSRPHFIQAPAPVPIELQGLAHFDL
ncbi:MAG: hypothetical protein OXC63_03580 [Aestuariivita sp.]|nr:hypothetical protein [Aestuariivita sp.]MCY4346944.1 hypothetical protein [Aestuariivita sp.]